MLPCAMLTFSPAFCLITTYRSYSYRYLAPSWLTVRPGGARRIWRRIAGAAVARRLIILYLPLFSGRRTYRARFLALFDNLA